MLKRARDYHLFSRTVFPIYALYTAGWVIGGVLYSASGRLGLLWGPLGELRRAFTDTHPVRTVPSSGSWMDWIPVFLCGGFLLAELRRHPNHKGHGERLLLGAYSVATVSAVSIVLAREFAEAFYGVLALVAAALFTLARWRTWTLRLRWAALGTVVVAASISMALLRLRDMSHLGRG